MVTSTPRAETPKYTPSYQHIAGLTLSTSVLDDLIMFVQENSPLCNDPTLGPDEAYSKYQVLPKDLIRLLNNVLGSVFPTRDSGLGDEFAPHNILGLTGEVEQEACEKLIECFIVMLEDLQSKLGCSFLSANIHPSGALLALEVDPHTASPDNSFQVIFF